MRADEGGAASEPPKQSGRESPANTSHLEVLQLTYSHTSVQDFLSTGMTGALCREHKGVQCTRNTSRLEGKHSQLNNCGLDQIYYTPTAGRTHPAALQGPVSLRVVVRTHSAADCPAPHTRTSHIRQGFTHTPNHTTRAGSI